MLEDIAKEVILFELNKLLIDSFFKFQLAARKKAEATWRKMAADREKFSFRNCVKVTAMMELAAR